MRSILDATLRLDKKRRYPARMMAHAETTRHHGNRHGRSEEARLAVLEAADNLLVERGFADVTIEGIAARAGVAKQTIYRWWTSKAELLLDGLLDDAATDLPPIDTGSAPQ